MSQTQTDPELIIKTFKAVAYFLVPAGGFMIVKEQFFDLIIFDSKQDKMLGYIMIFVGFLDYFIVPKIFQNILEKHKNDD